MKKIILTLIAFSLSYQASIAADDNILGISDGRLRNGDVHLDDIPVAIKSLIDFLMGIAGTIAVIMIIIGAYKILFGSIQQDKTKGRDTIIMAMGGFALAALSWFIIKIILSNFA
ncbi:hypothetical protein GW846_00850 [Candidatus Gracilibacteria bacterium]|nr:hypothetical protein [Candidatus Gracilibacteria bacterium]